MIWDVIIAFLSRVIDAIQEEFSRRTMTDWFWFFFPVLILFELPRYYFPLWGLLFAQWLGLDKRNRRKEEAFLQKKPLVSVVIAGRNEEATIAACIRSLLDQDYPNLEIIVVDDNSEDRMYAVANKFARRGQIRLIRNSAARGRSGRPSATNMGLRLANGEFLVSVDADCTFDRRLIRNLIAPFSDPRVGVVAGNLIVRNRERNLLTQLQTFEYAVSIDARKRWTDLFRCTLQASGALGGFRRSAVMDVGGWDQELAEDSDISLRLLRAGWKIRFAPDAVALTQVPETLRALIGQRGRWDRGGLRAYFMKHGKLFNPSTAGWGYAFQLATEFGFFVLASLIYPFYILWLLAYGPILLTFVMIASLSIYCTLSLISLLPIVRISDRLERPWALLPAAFLTPLYKEIFRWVRIKAIIMEIFRFKYKDPFLPDSAWTCAPRF